MTAVNSVSSIYSRERRQFRLIFGAVFLVLLVFTLLARLLPRRMRPWSPPGDRRLSPVAEARAVTDTVLPFAYL